MTDDGAPLDGEEILLDGNELAGDSPFFSIGAFERQPGRQRCWPTPPTTPATSASPCGSRTCVTGETAADEIPDTFYGAAWSADASALFYITVDDAWRPYRVWRHLVGTPAADDVIVYQEADEKFWVGVGLSRSERYLMISAASKLTSEVRLLDAADPDRGVHGGRAAPGGRRVRRRAPGAAGRHRAAADPAQRWRAELRAGQAHARQPGDVDAADRARADTRLLERRRLRRSPGHLSAPGRPDRAAHHPAARQRATRSSSPSRSTRSGRASNPEYDTRHFRLGYVSMVTPDSVYDCDFATGELTLLKRSAGAARSGWPRVRPGDYEQHRVWATADDGTRSRSRWCCRQARRGTARPPFLLYGYGTYEISIDPNFSIPRLSLLDRGFVFAIAHIRGGGEMGRPGMTTARCSTRSTLSPTSSRARGTWSPTGWTTPDRLVARGGSAGGLLMGAVVNMAPDAFGGIVAQVPFVDALTSILDPTLPLTVTGVGGVGRSAARPGGVPVHEVLHAVRERCDRHGLPADPRGDQPERHPGALPRARQVDRQAAGRGQGRPVPAEDRDVSRARRPVGRYDAWREEAMVLAWMVTTAQS